MPPNPAPPLSSLQLSTPFPLPFSAPKFQPPSLLLLRRIPVRAASSVSTRSKKNKVAQRGEGQSEAEELVRVILRKAGDGKEPLVARLSKYVKVVRTEHCFMLFEELGKRDSWLQCLEVILHLLFMILILLLCWIVILFPLKIQTNQYQPIYNKMKSKYRRTKEKVFRWMQRQRWYIADNGIYSKLISVMGKKGQTRMAMWLFSEMRKSGCRPDTSVYNALITAHLHSRDKAKALAKALGYFEKMKGTERCQPNVVTYNILLRGFAQARDVKQVNALFKDLDESIITPDIYTYNGVMDAYGKNGMLKEMESVLRRMKSNQCKPDTITFNLLIDAYGKRQAFDKMEQVFKSLLRSKEKPTLPTFNSMITNYGKARLREKAEFAFKKMIDLGFKPSYVTYECLIITYGYCDCASRAREIFDEMMNTQKEVKISTLNAMFDAYCINDLQYEADKLLDYAIKKGLVPNASTYKLLYKAYTKANMKELVDKLLKHMDEQGIVPNKKFFLEALEAFGSSQTRPKSGREIDASNAPQIGAKE